MVAIELDAEKMGYVVVVEGVEVFKAGKEEEEEEEEEEPEGCGCAEDVVVEAVPPAKPALQKGSDGAVAVDGLTTTPDGMLPMPTPPPDMRVDPPDAAVVCTAVDLGRDPLPPSHCPPEALTVVVWSMSKGGMSMRVHGGVAAAADVVPADAAAAATTAAAAADPGDDVDEV